MLVNIINIAAIGALKTFTDRYPILLNILNKSKHSTNDWDFFMTAAGTGMYLLINEVSDKEYKDITNQLKKINEQLVEAVNNLFSYIETRKNSDIQIQTLIGFWVLWNILGDPPTQEECKELASAIGVYLYNIINNLD